MKSEKGITLISMTIYVIVMLIIVTVMVILTSYFYGNVDVNSTETKLNQQYTKFNSYFTEEVNKKGNKIMGIGETEDATNNTKQQYILFSSGNQYTFVPENKAIYVNNVKNAEDITDCTFSKVEQNDKVIIAVTIKGDNNFTKFTKYTLVN